MNAAAVAPILVVAVGFAVFCLFDLFRTAEVRYLPSGLGWPRWRAAELAGSPAA